MHGMPSPTLTAEEGADLWEAELYLSLKRRTRLWQWLGAAGLALGALGLVATLTLLPLKSFVPVIVTVDRDTGNASVTSELGTITVSDEEALAQALVYSYVRDRETYHAIDQRERANKVYRFSRGRAAEDLRALYKPGNPLNPLERYGRALEGKVEIVSIVLPEPNLAQIRFSKTLRGEGAGKSRRFLATLRFGFDRETALPLSERWENPTGFFVSDYRIDEESGASQ